MVSKLVFPEGIDSFDVHEPGQTIESEHVNTVQAALVSIEIFSKNLENTLLAHINVNPVAHPATQISFSNAGIEIDGSPTNVQTAIGNHILQTVDTHNASSVSFLNTTALISGDPEDVQDAIDKHAIQTLNVHAANAITFDPSSLTFIDSTEVQAAIVEIASEYVRLDGATGTVTGPITFAGAVDFEDTVSVGGLFTTDGNSIFNGTATFNDNVVITASGKALTINGDLDVTGIIDPRSVKIRPESGDVALIIRNVGDTSSVVVEIDENGLISKDGTNPADIVFAPVNGTAGKSNISATLVQSAIAELNENVDGHIATDNNVHGFENIGGRDNIVVGTLNTQILENKTILSGFEGPKMVFYTENVEINSDEDRDKALEWVTGQNQIEIREKDFTHSTAAVSGSNIIPVSDSAIFLVDQYGEIDDGVVSVFTRKVTAVNPSNIEVDGAAITTLATNAYIRNVTLQNPLMFIDNEGNLEINGLNVRVGGSSTMNFDDNVDMTGNMSITGDVNITGQLQVNSAANEIILNVAGDGVAIYSNRVESDKKLIINADLEASGSTIFGDVYGTHQFLGGNFTLATTNINIGSDALTTSLNFNVKAGSVISFSDNISIAGDIVISGLVDGRDVSDDGVILDDHVDITDIYGPLTPIKHHALHVEHSFGDILKQYLTQDVVGPSNTVRVKNAFMFRKYADVQVLDDNTSFINTSIINIDFLDNKLVLADNVSGLAVADNARVVLLSDNTVDGNLTALSASFLGHFDAEFAHAASHIMTDVFDGFTVGSLIDPSIYERNVEDAIEYIGSIQDKIAGSKVSALNADASETTTIDINPVTSVYDLYKQGDEAIFWDDDSPIPQHRTIIGIDGYGGLNRIEIDADVDDLETAQNAQVSVVGVEANKVFFNNAASNLEYTQVLVDDAYGPTDTLILGYQGRFLIGDQVAVSSKVVSPIENSIIGISPDGYGNIAIQLHDPVGVALTVYDGARLSKLNIIDVQAAIDALNTRLDSIIDGGTW